MACIPIGAALLTAACSSTCQTRGRAQVSPFLGDAAGFRQGKSGEAKLVYLNPEADFGRYTKIQFDPVVLLAENAKSGPFASLSREDQRAVINYVDARIRNELLADYAVER